MPSAGDTFLSRDEPGDPSGSPDLRWEGVELTYPASPPVKALYPTNLELSAGEQVAIVGPSGSGKSSMLNLLGLLDQPTGGAYGLFGWDTASMSERRRAALRATTIGFVFQTFRLLPQRTATENVTLGMMYGNIQRGERWDRAREMLERVGLPHRMDARCATLSGGESQRVAIARALCHEPRMLLADEPTGNLDQRTGGEILDLLVDMMSPGLIQVIVTHDPQVAARCRRRIEIVDGHANELG